MPLRIQLLLVSLLVLVLPWAGCQYVREMESALRQGQEDALLGSARAIASVLDNRPALLDRAPGLSDATGEHTPVIYAHTLAGPMHIDGYMDDWNLEPRALERLDGPDSPRFVAGSDARYLHLFIEMPDDDVLYTTGDDTNAPTGDRLRLRFDTPAGVARDLLFATAAPGPILARSRGAGETAGDLGREHRALANWQETNTGYNLELRLPLAWIGYRLGFEIRDVDAGGEAAAAIHARAGVLVTPMPRLSSLLDEFAQPGLAVRVTNSAGWILGASDAEASDDADREIAQRESLLNRIYVRILDTRVPDARRRDETPGRIDGSHVTAALEGDSGASWFQAEERALIAVAEPVHGAGHVIGAVVLEQGSDRILTLTSAALTRLLNLTLFATVFAAAGLLAYATWLSVRIRRLRDAAESAIGKDGRVAHGIPGIGAKDELGDLSRSFTDMLERLDEYTRYLRSLASKLSHELRTPLAIVSTSLENLEHEALPEDARQLASRAMDGTQRLARIVTAMSAATRIEQSIEGAEPERFDLAALVGGNVSGYREAFPARRFKLCAPAGPCPFSGVPDLLSQLLDKLVDNAVDFSATGALIDISLQREQDRYRLRIFNGGAKLPASMHAQLFDSLVSVRHGPSETPHLGLGLYIARLIAEFHGGAISARNAESGSDGALGVEFEVDLPAP